VREAEEARAAAARKVEQDAADAAAAAERKRLDDEAAARRAEESAALEVMKQEALRKDRIRDAAPALLAAAQLALAECAGLIATPAGEALAAAVTLATGEEA
jgi:hypothetical protein